MVTQTSTASPGATAEGPMADVPGRPMIYDDLKQLPQDGNRYEIIDGEPVVSPAPSRLHQKLTVRLLLLIHAYLVRHNLGDDVYPAPVDVRLHPHRIVQPDLVYVGPDRRSILADPALIEGAPDLIVEILSPSNRPYDLQVKYRVYAAAGVREYWVADPEFATLSIFVLRDGRYELEPNEAGRARSVLLPGLEIDVAALFADLT